MTAPALLESLKAHGVTVASNGDRLKLAAPPGVLKPRVLDLARRHKVELLQLLDLENRSRAYSETPPVPPADGLIRRGDFIAPTKATLPAYRAHFEAKAVSANAEPDRQTERIRRLGADISPAELLAAHRTIKPLLKTQLNRSDLHEPALTLACADKREKARTSDATRPAREFYPRDVYQPEKATGEASNEQDNE